MSVSEDGHAALVDGHISGTPEQGWVTENSGHAHRNLPGGGRLEVRPGLDRASSTCFQWRHLLADGPPSPWFGTAPKITQAQLDADHHAHRCPTVHSIRFQELSRHLRAAAAEAGLTAPTFSSLPPDAITRSIKRPPGETPVVKVKLSGRSESIVWADMVDGVLLCNDRTGDDALRAELAAAR